MSFVEKDGIKDCKNIFQLIQFVDSNTLNQLLSSLWYARAVISHLSPLAKQILLRILLLGGECESKMIRDWVLPSFSASINDVFEELHGQHLVDKNKEGDWKINLLFKEQLQNLLYGSPKESQGPKEYWESINKQPLKKKKAVASDGTNLTSSLISDLDLHASNKWNKILEFMVDPDNFIVLQPQEAAPAKSKNELPTINRWLVELILQAKLMQRVKHPDTGEETSLLSLTMFGYEFMLMGMQEQLWVLISEYIRMGAARKMSLFHIIEYLLILSECELGQPYPRLRKEVVDRKVFTTIFVITSELQELGLTYILPSKKKSQRYYPSRLAINLFQRRNSINHSTNPKVFEETSKANSTSTNNTNALGKELKSKQINNNNNNISILAQRGKRISIVVETNLKVYAYTTSNLQLRMIDLFIDVEFRLPNMAVGQLSRDSVRRALLNGITASQIVHFLASHAHDKMKVNLPVIPENVTDQIYLWERERDKVKPVSSYFLSRISPEMWNIYHEAATTNGVLLWSDKDTLRMVVTEAGRSVIKAVNV